MDRKIYTQKLDKLDIITLFDQLQAGTLTIGAETHGECFKLFYADTPGEEMASICKKCFQFFPVSTHGNNRNTL